MIRASRQRGFTLIELLFVVSIVAILAAVAIPAYQDYIARSQVAEGMHLIAPLKQAVSAYYDRWGVLPRDNASAGLASPDALRGRYVASMTVANGEIEIRYVGKQFVNRNIADGLVVLRPARPAGDATGTLLWICQAGQVPKGVTVFGDLPASGLIEQKYLGGACK